MNCANSVSAAKLFLQLTPKRASQPVLEFLLPRGSDAVATSGIALRSPSARILRAQIQPAAKPKLGGAPTTRWKIALRSQAGVTPRTVSYTSTRRYTQAVYNPQKDDEGNDMKLDITPRAAKRLTDVMRKDDNPHLALRIQVESGGCHGFQYLMSLVTLPATLPSEPAAGAEPSTHPGEGANSGTIREDDTIFTYSKEGQEEEADLTAPKIILDQPSLELLKGSKVDYTMELIGSQFKIVDNPLATSSCGCGTSFDVVI